MKLRLLAVAALASVSSSAFAADAVFESTTPAFNWSGAYIGAQIGYGVGGHADYVYLDAEDEDGSYDYSNRLRGLLGGVYVGYNHQFSNNVVLGAEADVAFGDVHGSGVAPGYPMEFAASSKIDRTASARVRLGYAMDRFMPYIAGGVSYGHLKFNETEIGEGLYGTGSRNLFGWTVGAGAEYALDANWSIRGEYRYTKFNKKDFTTDASDNYSVKADSHDIRLGVTYRF